MTQKIILATLMLSSLFDLSSEIQKENLFSYFDEKKFFSAKFLQTTSLKDKERTINGIIKATRKGAFKIEYFEPIKEIISADDTFFYKLDLELEQVDIVPKEQFFQDTPINIFISNIEELKKLYEVKSCEKKVNFLSCRLAPIDESSFIENLNINFTGNELKSFSYSDTFEQKVTIKLSEISWEKFDDSELVMEIPQGIDIVYH